MDNIVTVDKYYRPLYEGDYVITKHGRVCKIIWHRSCAHIGYDLEPIHSTYPKPDEYDLWEPRNLIKINNMYDVNERRIAEIIEMEGIR